MVVLNNQFVYCVRFGGAGMKRMQQVNSEGDDVVGRLWEKKGGMSL
jgi:hypothetical protein